jgi:saccharopine dehydrogenase-like NADP-dependent oxidoreductase
MTVVIVGGAGAMGRWAVRGVAKLGSASRLLVADLDTTRAQMIVDEVGGPCSVVKLDAKDPNALRELFAECDVVLNTMGPFSLFARPILEEAIESGCDYLDIDDDWQSTLEAFEFDAAARERGCRVVKGIGGSPGISNLCAMVAARALDDVDEIVTGWSLSGAVVEDQPAYLTQASGPSAAVEHWLIQLSGTLRAWRNGAEQDVAPLQPVDLDYPGIGAVRTYTVGHPEAVTLPRYIDGIVTSMNVMSGPEWIFDHARTVAAAYDAGTLSLAEGARQLEDHPAPPAQRGPRDPLSSVWALARGRRDGQPLAVSVQPASRLPGKMGATGTALAIGLELLRRRGITRPGVHAPEGVIDPEAFFELYAGFVATPMSPADVLVVRELPDASLTIADVAAER